MVQLIAKSELTGGLLAGGKSRRFGQDKAQQTYQGETFMQRGICLLESLCDNVLISANDSNASSFSESGRKIVIDEYKDMGPLSGIYSLLKESTTDHLLILSCDMPLLTKDILMKMLPQVHHKIVCWQYPDNKQNPFPMLIDKSCLSIIKQMFDNHDLRVKSIFEQCDTELLKMDTDDIQLFSNINTIEDLNKIV